MSKQDFKNVQVYLNCATESTQQIFTAVFLPKAHIKGAWFSQIFSFHNLIDRLAKNTDIYITCNRGRISSVGKRFMIAERVVVFRFPE